VRRLELVRFFAPSSAARALAASCAVLALEGLTAGCAAVPATLGVRAASAALDRAASQPVARSAAAERPADRTYRLKLAAELLEKAREDAAGGRFESARALAREAERLALGAPRGGGA
jgi:hypothetical protein